MASNITPKATANWHVCSSALMACCTIVGLNMDVGGGPPTPADVLAPGVLFVPFPSEEEVEVGIIVGDDDDKGEEVRILFCWATINRSYSLPARRRNSSKMAKRTTPMQEPPNMALEWMCHAVDMKHTSTTSQFQSICGGIMDVRFIFSFSLSFLLYIRVRVGMMRRGVCLR